MEIRRSFRLAPFIGALVLIGSCTDSTAPLDRVLGTWDLVTVAGQSLPAETTHLGASTHFVADSAAYTFSRDLTFSYAWHGTQVDDIPPGTTAVSDVEEGTFSVRGDSVLIVAGNGVLTVGIVSGNSIVIPHPRYRRAFSRRP